MARIPLLSLEDMTREQRRVFELFTGVSKRSGRRARGAPYHLTLHWPEFTEKWQQLGTLVRAQRSVPVRLAELAMLVTVRHWNCAYAGRTHAESARREGVSDTIVDAIEAGHRPVFDDPDEALIYDYCKELLNTHFVSSEKHRAVVERLGVPGVIQLTALIGYYVTIAMALNAHGIESDPQTSADSSEAAG